MFWRRRFLADDGAKGHRLGSRQRGSSLSQLLTAESKPLRCPRLEDNARTCGIFDFSAENAKTEDCLAERGGFEPSRPFILRMAFGFRAHFLMRETLRGKTRLRNSPVSLRHCPNDGLGGLKLQNLWQSKWSASCGRTVRRRLTTAGGNRLPQARRYFLT